MKAKRTPAAETRALIIDAARALLVDEGPAAVTVVSVMERANVSRTAFYRQFDSIYDLLAEIVLLMRADLMAESGTWMTIPAAVGSPAVVYPNLVVWARAVGENIDLLTAVHDACACDPRLQDLWRESFIQPFADASEVSIERDQKAGAVSPEVDARATALMLTLLGEAAMFELVGRQRVSPERYAEIVAPFWSNVLFGTLPDEDHSSR
jgi:AcrR family transcriptional regulator